MKLVSTSNIIPLTLEEELNQIAWDFTHTEAYTHFPIGVLELEAYARQTWITTVQHRFGITYSQAYNLLNHRLVRDYLRSRQESTS